MNAGLIKTAFLGRLAQVYGEPRNVDGLALELARYAPMHATEDGLRSSASKLIETRRTKGFPAAAELIAVIRTTPKGNADQAPISKTRFENCEAPMEWILETDPRWDELCRLWLTEHPKPAFAFGSRNAQGSGWFFPLHHVDAIRA